MTRIKLPSRNWLIFLGIVGTWTSALVYDRYHKKRALRKWCHSVSHLAQETIPANSLGRRITILLGAPPGDGLRVSREHFHEYVKPILVAGALDWEVIEGRREGEIRAGLAEKIRKMRERNGELRSQEEDIAISQEDAVGLVRQTMGIKEWDGVRGDLVIGRHVWKEYIRGLHEGWLGPMDAPSPPKSPEVNEPSIDPPIPSSFQLQTQNEDLDVKAKEKIPDAESKPEPKPEAKASPTPSYITPSDYDTCDLASTFPSELPPSTAVPLPHILGFLNTPKRMWRFLHRREIAESTGASVAALVLASHTRPYRHDTNVVSPIPTREDEGSPTSAQDPQPLWEQEVLLQEAEPEWHKSVRKENAEGDESERVWKEDMVIDARIGDLMKTFELPEGARERGERLEEEERRNGESYWSKAKKWAGYGRREKKGWDMGFEGDEDN